MADGLHLRYGRCQAGEKGAGDDGVADVQFFEVGDGEEFVDVGVIESVTGVDPQAEIMGELGAFDEAMQFRLPRFACRVGEGARVEFDVFGLEVGGGADLLRIRIDKEADDGADAVEFVDGVGESLAMG